MIATLHLLAEMPRTGAELLLWLATGVSLVLFHSFLNAALSPRKESPTRTIRPV